MQAMGHLIPPAGRRWAALLLCTGLAACQPAAPTASAAATATPPAVRYPDASYSKGRLRPAYFRCVEGVQDAGTLQTCGREELAYQQKHLQAATATIVAGLDDGASAAFAATEAAWRRDTDRYCTASANAAVDALLAAQECRLSRVAYRADALLAHIRSRDTSFTQASLRPQYTRCVQDARGMDDKLQACDATEFAYQQEQLVAQVSRLMAGPDGPAKDRWMDEQAYWAKDTDNRCAPISDHVGALLDAQSCRINRYANRAVELQAHTLAPGLQ
ncbi:lysozyme inhibitor LprI family protein [Stenotrophomonas sp. ZAC14D2_NAIMI4_7]|uniref:lysozyme inhibitor LprI family protein n=1 Tax=Stenotrophomonas sp. ZAC14D2_NAIMI4_7 TaxID=2072405 RepID=UPI002D7756B7|nr:lysozyme inhibitor LprI family protein [Stenotrophomonas sp. ZAC14D2_NAIMI4_7]